MSLVSEEGCWNRTRVTSVLRPGHPVIGLIQSPSTFHTHITSDLILVLLQDKLDPSTFRIHQSWSRPSRLDQDHFFWPLFWVSSFLFSLVTHNFTASQFLLSFLRCTSALATSTMGITINPMLPVALVPWRDTLPSSRAASTTSTAGKHPTVLPTYYIQHHWCTFIFASNKTKSCQIQVSLATSSWLRCSEDRKDPLKPGHKKYGHWEDSPSKCKMRN